MQTSKYLKRVLSIASIVIITVFSFSILGYILEPVSYSFYFNHDLEEIEKSGEDVDLAFVGASRVYRSFVPEVFEKKLGFKNVVNAGSSSQPIEGSYYQTKELIDRVHPETIVLGITWDEFLISEKNVQGGLIVYDRLQGLNRLQYGLSYFEGKDKYYMLRTYRFRENLDVTAPMKYVIEKDKIIENNYESINENTTEYYADTGFVYSNETYKQGMIEKVSDERGFDKSKIDKNKMEYLDKIVTLCQEEGVKLHLVTGITSMMQLYGIEGYQAANEYYEEYASRNGLIYHNLNYLKGRESLFPDSVMHDNNHLNGEGATILSGIYADILEKDMSGESTEHYFYDDLNELKQDVNRIVALTAKIEEKGRQCQITIDSSRNKDIIPEYQIEICQREDSEYQVAVEWTTESILEIELLEKGDTVRVRARTDKNDTQEAVQEYVY